MSLLLALTGSSSATYTLSVEPVSYAVTNNSVDLLFNRVLQVDQGSYLVTPKNVDLVYTTSGATYTLSVEPCSYNVTAFNVDLELTQNGRSKLYNQNLVDHPSWAWNTKKAEVKPEEIKVFEELTDFKINLSAELPEENSAIEEEVKSLEVQLAALNIHVEKMQSYDKLFKLEEALRIEQERIAQEDEEYAIALCVAMLL